MPYFIISEILCVIFLTRYFLEEVREDAGTEVLTQKETILGVLGVITALFYDFFVGCVLAMILNLTVGRLIGAYILPKTENVTEYNLLEISDSQYIQIDEYRYQYIADTDKGGQIKSISKKAAYINKGDYKPIAIEHTKSFKEDWYTTWFTPDLTLYESEYVEFYLPAEESLK